MRKFILRFNGKLTYDEEDKIQSIIKSKKSDFLKYKEIEHLNILNDPSFTNKYQKNLLINIYETLVTNSNYMDEIENYGYSKELFVPIENPEDLFGERYLKIENRYLLMNRLKKLKELSYKKKNMDILGRQKLSYHKALLEWCENDPRSLLEMQIHNSRGKHLLKRKKFKLNKKEIKFITKVGLIKIREDVTDYINIRIKHPSPSQKFEIDSDHPINTAKIAKGLCCRVCANECYKVKEWSF